MARTASGKQVIFAWFENKKAVLAWYTSETHIHAMQLVFPGHQPSASALKDIPDDTPVLTIASVTPADPANAAPGAPPFTQIAIEHYTPLAGGIAVGGRFAPAALTVPRPREVTPLAERRTDTDKLIASRRTMIEPHGQVGAARGAATGGGSSSSTRSARWPRSACSADSSRTRRGPRAGEGSSRAWCTRTASAASWPS